MKNFKLCLLTFCAFFLIHAPAQAENHCVCVEQTDFAPILLEDVYKRIEAEGGQVGFNPNAYGNGSAM